PDRDLARPERPHHGIEGLLGRHPPGAPATRRSFDPVRRGDATPRRGGTARMSDFATLADLTGQPDGAETYGDEAKTRMGFFTDTSVCIGCKACEVACKECNVVPEDGLVWTGESYDNTSALGANTWRHVAFIEQHKPLRGD